MNTNPPPSVLIVDNDEQLVDLFASYLEDGYVVKTATGGEEALSKIDESVDVVLLDRRMPDLGGDEVLKRLHERGFDPMVALITAVKPTEEVVDLDFDEYVLKPTDERELNRTVESLVRRLNYHRQRQRCYRLATKLAILETSAEGCEQSEEYQRLKSEFREAQQRADEWLQAVIETDACSEAYADIH